MPKEIRFNGVIHRFPDDFTDADIQAALSSVSDAPPVASRRSSPTKPTAAFRAMTPENFTEVMAAVDRFETDRTRGGREALPMMGGTVGAVLGGIPGAALGGAAGTAFRNLDRAIAGERVPTTASAMAKDIALQGAAYGATEAIGRGVTSAATKGAKAVYRGFLKPSISQRMAPKAEQIVQTALDEALPITRSGAATGRRIIADLKNEVDDILQKSPGTVDLKDVANKVRSFARARYNRPGANPADLDAALAVADRIDKHASLAGNTQASLSIANETKRALDEAVGDAGFGVKTGAVRTTEKAARRLLREGLEKEAPAIIPLNARESKLIDATRAIYQGVQREANRNAMFGVPSVLAGMAGGADYAARRDPYSAAATALAVRVGMHPAVASRAAITAYRIGKQLGVGVSTAARLAVYAVSQQADDQGNGDDPNIGQ